MFDKQKCGYLTLGWHPRILNTILSQVGHGVVAGTTSSSYSSGSWLGLPSSPGVTIVDTPGFNSTIADMEELVWLLAELQEVSTVLGLTSFFLLVLVLIELKGNGLYLLHLIQVDLFVVTFKYGDRFSPELGR